MKRLLFLCVANSARSQMAEGIARQLFGKQVEVYSAGSKPTIVNPFATKALAEIGISTASHSSKLVTDLDTASMDLIVTLCADEVCPVVPGKVRKLHWPFPDPARPGQSEEDGLKEFRVVREMIRAKLPELRAHLGI